MDKDSEDLQRRQKKKKHHRSRSRSQKKHKRSRSRSQRKKDKKKKQKQNDKYNDRSNSKQKQSLRQKELSQKEDNKILQENAVEPSKETKQKQKKSSRQQNQGYRERKQKDRQSRDRDRKKDKHRQRSDRQYRDRDNKQRQRHDKESYRQKQRQKRSKYEERSKSRERRKQKERQRQRDILKRDNRREDREKDRDREKERDRPRQRERDYKRQKDRQRSRDKNQRSKDRGGRQHSRQHLQQPSSSRNIQRHGNGRRQRTPQRRRHRQQQRQRFRFDSPPKSDESDISDNPQKMQKLNRTKAQQQLVTSKADKKLYLGNLPPNITSQQLMDMLNVALKKMEINTDVDGDSIISAWISPDGVGHYAFVEFRTAQQATNGLALNGASLFGYQLKLGRPKQYIQYNKQMLSKFGSDSSIDTILKKVQAIGGQIQLQVIQKIIHPPSRIIVLKHIVTVDELAIDEEYQQIMDDVKDMAKRFGDVIKVVIPRPHEVIDLQEVQRRVKGLGYIFVQYRTIQQAIFARKQFIQKQFSSRSVACSFIDEKRWLQGEYDICEKVVIDF